jgi:hypothetical protein
MIEIHTLSTTVHSFLRVLASNAHDDKLLLTLSKVKRGLKVEVFDVSHPCISTHC